MTHENSARSDMEFLSPAVAGRLEGDVVMVTGATRGVGAELALALAQEGAHAVIVGRDADAGESVAENIRRAGFAASVAVADVTREDQIDAAVQTVLDEYGRIDTLICAAGTSARKGPLWLAEEADFRACFDLNVLGTMLSMKAVMPSMIERGKGCIVAIGGTYGHKGVRNFSVYAASKWALRGLIKSAALDAGAFGLRVNLVSPGGIEGEKLTGMFKRTAEQEGISFEAVHNRFTAGSALGRLVAPSDIADAMLYLVSDTGRMITGQDIVVDGGTLI